MVTERSLNTQAVAPSRDKTTTGGSAKESQAGNTDPSSSSNRHMSTYQLFPWLLPSAEHRNLAADVENLLIEEGVLSILSGGSLNCKDEANMEDPEIIGYFSIISSLAASYLRLWLSLREIQFKDAHPRLAKAMSCVISYVHAQLEADETGHREESADEWGVCVDSSTNVRSVAAASGLTTPKKEKSPADLTIKTNIGHTSPVASPQRSPCLPAYNKVRGEESASARASVPWLLLHSDTMSVAACMASDPGLQSSIYGWIKKLFLEPDSSGDEDGDPLSKRGQELLFKERQLESAMDLAKIISNKYRAINVRSERYSFERSTETSEVAAAGGASSSTQLPASLSNFQPKAVITAQNSEMATHVMFHGYKDVLAICDGLKVGLWSLENGSKLGSVDRKLVRNSNLTAHYNSAEAMSSFNISPVLSRITSLQWINQSNDSLMFTGADDGTVHIWRDNLGDDLMDNGDRRSSNTNAGDVSPTSKGIAISGNDSSGVNRITPSIAAAFTALPDIAPSSRGSGMISDWQQHSGVLAVGGNSETIRLWDVNREQCARVLHTGTNKCTTAISSQSIAWRSSHDGPEFIQPFGVTSGGRGDTSNGHWSWVFAGFGDGSVAVFDEKVPTQGGRVHSARDDNHWIVHAYIREDIPEVIVGALYGGVKFWDLRTMRVFKTIEVLSVYF